MMLGAQRAVLVPFRFQSISVYLGWAGLAGLGHIGARDWDPPVRLFIWCEAIPANRT